MRTFSSQLKGIAYIIIILLLSQSCLIYRKSPSIEKHTNSNKNTALKISTADGKIYKVRWIEERDGNIYSIANTRRVYIEKEGLKIGRHNPELFNIENRGKYLYGLEMISHDTSTVIIPVNQIEIIKKVSVGRTVGVNVSILLGCIATFGLLAWAFA